MVPPNATTPDPVGQKGNGMDKDAVVLVVEDDPLLADMAAEMIEEAGLKAVAVDSVDAALDYLKEGADRVAAMFSDVRLRGPLNGIELAAFVAVRWPQIAICVTSGVALERPYRLPKNAQFMPKPWKPQEVIAFVEKAARQR
ncbi:response regulator [Lichenihabitans sp. Uapishka_5]|uniref:response regulator n=1 Tax=Lichenihabitans sp. Uapishka_5 TaxID=3037302 RepID=UPI0029E80061|nr:response regulator [Lichenihabitans sp. Uapishka_5]MDX7953324.1 response regulator [Lichenihabitans sp. Uapishka_5]